MPVLNEQEAISPFLDAVQKSCASIHGCRFEYIFVDDGSTDLTLQHLQAFANEGLPIKIVELSRNFGKEAALSAGLDHADGDAVIPIDVDLQDPPSLIAEMITEWRNGWEVVLASRVDRSSDSLAKSASARLFYWLHNKMSNPSIPVNCG